MFLSGEGGRVCFALREIGKVKGGGEHVGLAAAERARGKRDERIRESVVESRLRESAVSKYLQAVGRASPVRRLVSRFRKSRSISSEG